jgi:hypothetical protein
LLIKHFQGLLQPGLLCIAETSCPVLWVRCEEGVKRGALPLLLLFVELLLGLLLMPLLLLLLAPLLLLRLLPLLLLLGRVLPPAIVHMDWRRPRKPGGRRPYEARLLSCCGRGCLVGALALARQLLLRLLLLLLEAHHALLLRLCLLLGRLLLLAVAGRVCPARAAGLHPAGAGRAAGLPALVMGPAAAGCGRCRSCCCCCCCCRRHGRVIRAWLSGGR